MTKIVSITEHVQLYLADLKESFWGDLEGRTKLAGSTCSRPSRSGCVTAMRIWTAINAVRGSLANTATATMKGIL